MGEKDTGAGFTSSMTGGERAAALIYLPLHVVLLPALLSWFGVRAQLTAANANLILYFTGTAYMLLLLGKFLRREFDPLCDAPLRCLREVAVSYALMRGFNICLAMILAAVGMTENPNNAAVTDMAMSDIGKTSALAVFLAPIVEEIMFRGAVFGAIRSRSRIAAYAVSMLLFSVYHVWGYAVREPLMWIYILQYLPVSYLLCRCYERCNSIWGNIFLHMLINYVSINALVELQELL